MALRGWQGPTPPLGANWSMNTRSPQAVGLVGWWPTISVGGLLPGRVGVKTPAALVNGATVAPHQIVGQALSLDGVDDHVLIANDQSLDFTTAYTLSGWFYPRQARNFEALFFRGDGTTDDIEVYFGSGRFITIVHNRGNGGTFTSHATGIVTVTVGAWQHLAIVYESAAASRWFIYKDGVLVDSGVSSGGGVEPLDTNRSWRIGATANAATFSATNELDGLVADPRMYNRALSPAEVFALYAPQTRWDLYGVPMTRSKVAAAAAGLVPGVRPFMVRAA